MTLAKKLQHEVGIIHRQQADNYDQLNSMVRKMADVLRFNFEFKGNHCVKVVPKCAQCSRDMGTELWVPPPMSMSFYEVCNCRCHKKVQATACYPIGTPSPDLCAAPERPKRKR